MGDICVNRAVPGLVPLRAINSQVVQICGSVELESAILVGYLGILLTLM